MTRVVRVCTAIAFAALVSGGLTVTLRAQTAAAAEVSVDQLFADASAKEAAVRKALETEQPLPTLLKAVRTVVADYETVVRRYPTSGYCDDALWRAARLSRDAFEEFHEARERTTALRLLQLLQSGYPSSKFAKQSPEQIAWLNAHPAKAGSAVGSTAVAVNEVPAAPSVAASAPPAPPLTPAAAAVSTSAADNLESGRTPASAPAKLANIKGIRRVVLPDVVRIVVELDGEVPFHAERIENPTRVFVDLLSTRANPSLIDQTIRYDADSDVVRQVRVGRHPNSTTRVVLEAAGVSSYSVYPLYSPFRLVIDCLRGTPAMASAAPATAVPVPVPAIAAPAPAAAAPARTGTTPPSSRRPATVAVPASAAAPAPVAPPAPTPVPVDAHAIPTTPAPTTTSPLPPVAKVADKPSDRPAWATALAKPVAAVLPARRVRWVAPMPSGVVRRLPDVDAPSVIEVSASDALPKSLPSATATPPAGEPSRNVTGGFSIARQLGLGVSRIVIDPGHGGHDPGAKGDDTTEAELVLDVALRLEKLLTKVPGVDVVLTRRGNEFVSLQERTAIANREGADLFLSIHANASNVPAARGVETYFLNFASSQNAAAVAARENATSDQTMGVLQDVVKAIALNSKRDESRDFATYVQKEMLESIRGANKTVKDLGVKQAPFVVLIGASMPSVLAEISFLTNPQEAKLLKSSSYRQRIAQALFQGIKSYQLSLKNGSAITQQQN